MTLGISQALAAAAADGSLAEFFSDLTSCGGRVVAELVVHVHHVAEVVGEVAAEAQQL